MKLVLRKGKKLPVGTIREWGGYRVRKVAPGKWVKIGKVGKKRPSPKEFARRKSLANEVDVEHSLDQIREMYKRMPPGMGEELPVASKADLDKILTKTKIGLLSAGRNPNIEADMKMTDDQVSERQEQLKEDLKSRGFIITTGLGKYDGLAEESVMVMMHDADREELMQVGQRYNQDAVIYSDKGKNQMIFTTGENRGGRFEGKGWEELPTDVSDNFTELPVGSGRIRFNLDFNFDEIVKSIMNWLGLRV